MSIKPNRRLPALHRRVLDQLDAIAAIARDPTDLARRAPAISGWSVGQHGEHMVRVDRGIADGLARALAANGDGAEGGNGGPTLAGRLVLLIGRIPRGRGRAPGPYVPGDDIDAASLITGLDEARLAVERLDERLGEIAAARSTSPHPVFGRLRPAQWLRFMDVHHRHHLRIVDDILRAG